MPSGYFKCKEGVDAYNAVGKEYDNTLDDIRYEKILKQTQNSPHKNKNKKEVRNMIRLVADDGNVYLKYDLEEVCYDTIGAPQEVYHSNVGTYPIPITQPTLDYGADGTAREVVNGPIVRIDTGYSIPFTKENADKIHEVANDTSFTNRTQYLIKSNGRKYTVEKYEDFRDRTIEELQTGSYLKGESKSLKTK